MPRHVTDHERVGHDLVRRILNLRMPATSDSVPLARRAVVAAARASGLRDSHVAEFQVVVSEACANVVRHAYPPGSQGQMELELWLTEPSGLALIVRDFGAGLRPRLDSPGLGLGLPLMAALSNALDVRNTGRGTDVVVRFMPPAVEPAAQRPTLHQRFSRVAARARDAAQDVAAGPLSPGRETA